MNNVESVFSSKGRRGKTSTTRCRVAQGSAPEVFWDVLKLKPDPWGLERRLSGSEHLRVHTALAHNIL